MMNRTWTLIALAAAFVAISPTAAQAGWEEGIAAFSKNDFATAERELKPIVDSKPEWPGGHYMLGWTYIKLDKHREAITHLRKAYELDENNPAYQLRLGQAYVAAGRHGDAVGFLNKINPSALPQEQQAFLSELKAIALAKSGQEGQALNEFRATASLKPDDPKAQYQYGTAAYNAGDTQAAVGALSKAAQLEPRNATYQNALAKALNRLGRESRGSAKVAAYEKATRAAQAVVAVDGSYDNVMLLAEAQLGAKSYEQAVDNLERAASKDPNAWLPYFYIGQAHTALKRFGSAESSLRQALDKASAASDQQRIWKQLAFVYEKQKKFDDAILAYNQAGDEAGAQRARENKEIAEFNREVEKDNEELRRLREEQEKIKEQLKDLPGGPPPPSH